MTAPLETIYAVSSAPGRGGVAVIRVSGPHAGLVLNVMASPRAKPRMAAGRRIVHPRTGEALDRGIAIWFPGPQSFTGEDVAELQLHGGRAVVAAVLSALGDVPGLRLAEPGEFARRAFENGKIDLSEAEGLADLIDAETEGQRQQALRQATGALSSLYDGWRTALIDASALTEAAIDFSDEGDVGTQSFEQARGIVSMLLPVIRHHLADGRRGEILREGFHVVLAGAPNVGKSSLLNALAQREAAIVSDEAGTTRDVIEVRLDLMGMPVVVSDTAGIRQAQGAVEQEGIRRTIARARSADLVVWLTDAEDPQAVPPEDLRDLADRMLLVINKIDRFEEHTASGQLALGLRTQGETERLVLPEDMLGISVLTGVGLSDLVARIGGIAAEQIKPREDPAITQVRHRVAVEACVACLETFLREPAHQVEMRAEDLRTAVSALGRIAGRVDVEDVLDQVFARFCLGK